MANIVINVRKTSTQVTKLALLSTRLKIRAASTRLIKSGLRNSISSGYGIDKKLDRAIEDMLLLSRRTETLCKTLNQINQVYERTESRNLNYLRSRVNKIHTQLGEVLDGQYVIPSIVFDEDGSYGGNQGGPSSVWQEPEKSALYDIVRKYYPSMSDKEVADYLKKLNSEGCGYVAIINTIFAAYEGKEKLFEKTFGFSMYASNGDLNYNRLIVDFYAATDNHKKGFLGKDTINNKEDDSATEGYGTTPGSQKYRAELYLKSKDVDVEIKTNQKITPDNYKEISKDKYVVINYHYGNLYNMDGSLATQCLTNGYIDGGHSMVITGVTDDGKYIVSSWGGQFLIDPTEKIKNNGHTTTFDFVTYEYY